MENDVLREDEEKMKGEFWNVCEFECWVRGG